MRGVRILDTLRSSHSAVEVSAAKIDAEPCRSDDEMKTRAFKHCDQMFNMQGQQNIYKFKKGGGGVKILCRQMEFAIFHFMVLCSCLLVIS